MYQPPVNQHPAYQAPAHQASGVSKTDFESYVKANDAAPCEEYSQEILGFLEYHANGNSTPFLEPIVDTTLPPSLPVEGKIDDAECDRQGVHSLLEAILNSEPLSPLPNHANYFPEVRKELKICEAKTDETSIDEPPEVELKDLPPHLEYAFLEGDNKLPVIIAKDLSVREKAALIKVLQSHKRAIAWKLSDIKGINPEFCTHKILMEEDYTPAVQHQRRVNPKIHDVIKKEVEKLLDAGLIYPISDSPWVSPVHCVPKKGGFTVVENEQNELIPTRLVTGWRVCIDYRKLNEATRKDHFPLPFMDQMLERLAGNEYYCFLDGFSGYFQIPIDPNDQEKTTFTCPYGTFAYRRMPLGLACTWHIPEMYDGNLPRHDRKNDGSGVKTPTSSKLEKSHFMVKEGDWSCDIKSSKSGLKLIELRLTLSAKLLNRLLSVIEAFNTHSKRNLNRGANPLIAQTGMKPFKLSAMQAIRLRCSLGATSRENISVPIHDSSKNNEMRRITYTTDEKEMLAVVYAFENSDRTVHEQNALCLRTIRPQVSLC
ncbi:hypothetical protein Tco_0005914 [Tanacetum coccineum]